ncbi:hypothetical protein GA0115254_115682 [Streptomyces sp. Ncost-T10-10d]|nr:hypothetical protein GA0115254_115682 [Streptomyces sp. Ncost-T10-10d]
MTAVGLKPDIDEYTVFVHRVVQDLEAAGLDEAAEEIRQSPFPAPDDSESEGEGPDDGPSGERDTTGPWSPRFPAPEDSPSTDAGTRTGLPRLTEHRQERPES